MLHILVRDLIRLVKAPSALIVLVAIIVLPSAYSWYNVVAFWDPYGNTGNMSVCVVNEDKGGSSDLTGELNVGDSIVDALHENSQLKWEFTNREDAMSKLMEGKVYAVYLIPSDFTTDLLSITTGNFTQPALQYYVNEKTGPVSPKVTDTGSTTLEETINSTFVSTVSNAAVEAITKATGKAESTVDNAKSQALLKTDDAVASLNDARTALANADEKIANLQSKQAKATAALNVASDVLDATDESLADISNRALLVQNALIETAPKMSDAMADSIKSLSELEPYAEALGYGDEMRSAIEGLNKSSDSFYARVVPLTIKASGNVGSAANSLSASVASQKATVAQLKVSLAQLDTLLSTTRASLAQTNSMLGSIEEDLVAVRNDVATFSASSLVSELIGITDKMDPQSIADFMGSPTVVRTEQLYELSSYGAAMAPLFMSLTFWIGAFMFLVVFRQEVDDEGVKNLTIGQRYISRFLFFAVPAMLQAVVCCAGLLALGLEVVNAPAMFLASVLASLAYLSIIYALSTTLQHIGKGLCIVFVFLQIPAATGLYPIEMTAGFYQAISPLFPFTYGIAAIRECICGFYGTQYIEEIVILLVYFALFMVFGLVFRPILSNVNRMVAREIGETGLLNGEYVEVPERKYRISQALMALTDRAGYRDELQKRYNRFMRSYPRIMKVAIVSCFIVPIIFGVVGSLVNFDKVIILTQWLGWFVFMIVIFIGLEVFRHGFRSQFALEAMSDEELIDATKRKDTMHQTIHHGTLRTRKAFAFWDVYDPAEEAKAEQDGGDPSKTGRIRLYEMVHTKQYTLQWKGRKKQSDDKPTLSDEGANRKAKHEANHETNREVGHEANFEVNLKANHEAGFETSLEANHEANHWFNRGANQEANQEANHEANQEKFGAIFEQEDGEEFLASLEGWNMNDFDPNKPPKSHGKHCRPEQREDDDA